MAIEPKFRPSLTKKELALIARLAKYAYEIPAIRDMFEVSELVDIHKLQKNIGLFNFKISNEFTQPSYVPTGTAKQKIEIEDLLSEDEIAKSLGLKEGIDYSSTTAMHNAYKNKQMAESLGAKASPEDEIAASKWLTYCQENNLNPDSGMDK